MLPRGHYSYERGVSLGAHRIGCALGNREAADAVAGKGATASSVKGLIVLVNALRCDKQEEMEDLVHEMAKEFGDDASKPSVYRKTLSQLISLAKLASSIPPNSVLAEAMQSALKATTQSPSERLLRAMEGGAQPPKRII